MHKKFILISISVLLLVVFSAFYFSKVMALFGVVFLGSVNALRIVFTNPSGITDIVIRLWALFLYGLGIKKWRHPWGTVYDDETKEPIYGASISMLDVDNKIVATSLTDKDGRYGFLVEPGFYHITAKKKGYIFPSSKLFGRGSDVVYNDLYFGNFIEIKKNDAVIINNIPMQRFDFDWHEFAKQEQYKYQFYHAGDKALGQIINVTFFVGFVTSVLVLFGEPIKIHNVVILALYIILFLSNRKAWRGHARGSVFFKDTNLPIAYGILRVKSEDRKEVTHKIIDRIGHYYCLVPDGVYTVNIEKKNQDGSYTKIYEEEKIEVKNGFLRKEFRV